MNKKGLLVNHAMENLKDWLFYPSKPAGKEFIKKEILLVSLNYKDGLKDTKFFAAVINDFYEKYHSEVSWRKKLNGETLTRVEIEEVLNYVILISK